MNIYYYEYLLRLTYVGYCGSFVLFAVSKLKRCDRSKCPTATTLI